MSEKRRPLRTFFILLLIGLPVLVLAAGILLWFIPDVPFGDPDSGTIEYVVYPYPRDTMATVAEGLGEAGLVKNPWYMYRRYWILYKFGFQEELKAGRFQLPYGARPSELISALTSPSDENRVYTGLDIVPGLTASEIAVTVEKAGFASRDDVYSSILEIASEYPVLENEYGLQGYLFPEKHNLETPVAMNDDISRQNADMIIRLLADRFFEVLDEIDPGWKDLTALQLHEKVTLASIVERECRAPEEAPLIAAVFNNRLKSGMPLQSCATLDFALTETEDGKPFVKEYLESNRRILIRYTTDVHSEFNTYWERGLPPGPIAIPGKNSLKAAFFPADSDVLFFVVKDGSAGTHTFTTEYSDHLEARASYLDQYRVKD